MNTCVIFKDQHGHGRGHSASLNKMSRSLPQIKPWAVKRHVINVHFKQKYLKFSPKYKTIEIDEHIHVCRTHAPLNSWLNQFFSPTILYVGFFHIVKPTNK